LKIGLAFLFSAARFFSAKVFCIDGTEMTKREVKEEYRKPKATLSLNRKGARCTRVLSQSLPAQAVRDADVWW
jgi:flagellar biosynthesis protein FlhB